MKTPKLLFTTLAATALCFGSVLAQDLPSDLTPISAEDAPVYGTYWSMAYWPYYPPCPMNCWGIGLDLYYSASVGTNIIWVDDSFTTSGRMSAENIDYPPDPGGGGDLGFSPWPADYRRNFVKFAQQMFFLINTNLAATDDTNIYISCLSFPPDTNTYPTLQIRPYQTNAVLIKANHFDYSAETSRDFALIVSDSAALPILKNIDFGGASDAQDGWLVQGIVPHLVVSDPMFILVTNLYPRQAFFKAIPYDGPQVVLSGPQPYDTVSNTIALHANISDLSGTSNSIFTVTVNGLPVPYTLGSSNTITLNTRYALNGVDTVEVKVLNHNATAYEPTNAPMDAPTVFDNVATIPLDFENGTYLSFQSDNASPDIGTNYILYGVTAPTYVTAKITEPSSGRTIRNLAGYDPSFNTVEIDWNFTDSNGTSPYTNDTYTVTFTASNSPSAVTTLQVTNKIERNGVRRANWVINHYQEMGAIDVPAVWYIFQSSDYQYINDELKKWFEAFETMYETLYFNDFASQSQYFSYQIGANRDNPTVSGIPLSTFPFKLNPSTASGWKNFIHDRMTNADYSDFNWQGHGNQWLIGGGPYPDWANYNLVNTKISAQEINGWAKAVTTGWRMRKVGMWACRTGRESFDNPVGGWYKAFGIYLTEQQINGLMQKNCGVFFLNDLYFVPPNTSGYGSTFGTGTDIEEVMASYEKWWVMGQSPFPGGASPNYSMQFAASRTIAAFPELSVCYPVLIGYPWLPFAGVYDNELMQGDHHQVTQ